MGDLHFLKIVNADRIVVAFPGQKNLDEVAHDAELKEFARIVFLVHGKRLIRRTCILAVMHEILLPDALRHLLKRKRIQSTAHIPALGQAPIRHTYAHSALNDLWKLQHP